MSQVVVAAILLVVQVVSPLPKAGSSVSKTPVTGDATDSERQDPGMPEEMRTRLAIERAEGEYKKILTSAEKVGDLTAQIQKVYTEKGKLSTDEIKKLGEVEKLAKRILSHSGGDVTSGEPAEADQMTLPRAIDRLSEVGASVKKNVTEKTRFVVSMQIISDSNDIVHLVHFIRRTNK